MLAGASVVKETERETEKSDDTFESGEKRIKISSSNSDSGTDISPLPLNASAFKRKKASSQSANFNASKIRRVNKIQLIESETHPNRKTQMKRTRNIDGSATMPQSPDIILNAGILSPGLQ